MARPAFRPAAPGPGPVERPDGPGRRPRTRPLGAQPPPPAGGGGPGPPPPGPSRTLRARLAALRRSLPQLLSGCRQVWLLTSDPARLGPVLAEVLPRVTVLPLTGPEGGGRDRPPEPADGLVVDLGPEPVPLARTAALAAALPPEAPVLVYAEEPDPPLEDAWQQGPGARRWARWRRALDAAGVALVPGITQAVSWEGRVLAAVVFGQRLPAVPAGSTPAVPPRIAWVGLFQSAADWGTDARTLSAGPLPVGYHLLRVDAAARPEGPGENALDLADPWTPPPDPPAVSITHLPWTLLHTGTGWGGRLRIARTALIAGPVAGTGRLAAFDRVWVPSPFVRNLLLESGLEAGRVAVLPPGILLPAGPRPPASRAAVHATGSAHLGGAPRPRHPLGRVRGRLSRAGGRAPGHLQPRPRPRPLRALAQGTRPGGPAGGPPHHPPHPASPAGRPGLPVRGRRPLRAAHPRRRPGSGLSGSPGPPHPGGGPRPGGPGGLPHRRQRLSGPRPTGAGTRPGRRAGLRRGLLVPGRFRGLGGDPAAGGSLGNRPAGAGGSRLAHGPAVHPGSRLPAAGAGMAAAGAARAGLPTAGSSAEGSPSCPLKRPLPACTWMSGSRASPWPSGWWPGWHGNSEPAARSWRHSRRQGPPPSISAPPGRPTGPVPPPRAGWWCSSRGASAQCLTAGCGAPSRPTPSGSPC
ncbi:protein of unknown function [Candidatus Hydrogenisulfobacillus filiaventi]|uniref:Uncharacterized protein n=1 Tax=Candidatus Hydrogenisulfobacillus filiaventi TaxID=2707344 RepID=A0A6F8ZDE8_9FIRM|nr:protein of unknown function [Candidatus Hydrogenisulfobacillus filiaventi]